MSVLRNSPSKSNFQFGRNFLIALLSIGLVGLSGLVAPSASAVCMEPPSIRDVTPNSGSTEGGGEVVIRGNCFERDATVTFDRDDAKVIALDPDRITVIVPAHAAGLVNIYVTNPGERPIELKEGYTYTDSRFAAVLYDANGGKGTLIDERSPYERGIEVVVLEPRGIERSGYNFVNWNTQANGEGTKYKPGETFKIEADTTLYAYWELIPPAVYTVTFNGNGATSGGMSPQSSSVPAALSPNLFLRTGYTFAGWNTVAGGGGTAYANGATYSFTTSATLYAQWTLIPVVFHTVTFNGTSANGGSTDSQTASSPTSLRLNGFTKTGYTFDSWNTQLNGGGLTYANGANYDFAADITLYARWTTLPLHTITFNANGGSGTMSAQSSSVASPINGNTFTRSGFNFVEWMTTPTGGIHYAVGTIYPFTEDLTLYAEWSAIIIPPTTGGGGGSAPVILTPVTHVVTFNPNGATSGSMTTMSSDKAAPLTKLAFSRTGFNFDHWSTKADIDGTLFNDEDSFPFYADTTLYAHWSLRAVRQVTFSSNGTTITSNSFQSSENPAALNPNSVVRSGYNFLGWNTLSDGSGVAFANGASYSFDFDLRLYAQWVLVPFQSSSISVSNPLVLPLGSNESLNLHLSIQNPDGTTTAATVQVPQGLVGVDSTIRITPISTTESVLLGLVSLQVEVLDVFGAPIPQMLEPLTMQLSNNFGEYVVAESSDGFIWSLLPELSGTTLGEGQKAGYFYDADGLIVVVTSHLTQFGLRKHQASQFQITAPSSAISVAVSAILARSGGSGSGVVRYATSTPTVCVVSEAGVVKATAAGTCRLTATKGGDAIFLNSSPSTVSIVVGQSKNALSISGAGATKVLTINLGATYAKTTATIQVKLPNAKNYQKVATKLLGSKGEAVVPLNAAQGSTVQALVAHKAIATLKVSG